MAGRVQDMHGGGFWKAQDAPSHTPHVPNNAWDKHSSKRVHEESDDRSLGHRFAKDCNLFQRFRRAGENVKAGRLSRPFACFVV